MRTTIPTKLYLSFGLMAGLIIAAAVITNNFMRETDANYRRLSDNTRAAALLAEAETALWQLRYGFPQFMAGDEATRQKIIAEEPNWYRKIDDSLEAYSRLASSDEARRALAALQTSYKQYIAARPRWFELQNGGKTQDAAEWRAQTTTPFGAATVQRFLELIDLQSTMSEAARVSITRHLTNIRRTFIAFVIVALLTAIFTGVFIARRVIRPLSQLGVLTREVQDAGIKVSTSVTEIVSTSNQQQATATEIAATTTEIGATSKEISGG